MVFPRGMVVVIQPKGSEREWEGGEKKIMAVTDMKKHVISVSLSNCGGFFSVCSSDVWLITYLSSVIYPGQPMREQKVKLQSRLQFLPSMKLKSPGRLPWSFPLISTNLVRFWKHWHLNEHIRQLYSFLCDWQCGMYPRKTFSQPQTLPSETKLSWGAGLFKFPRIFEGWGCVFFCLFVFCWNRPSANIFI